MVLCRVWARALRKNGGRVGKAVVSSCIALWKTRNLLDLQQLELSVEDILHSGLSKLGWYYLWDIKEPDKG